MLPEKKRNTNLGVGIGMFIQLAAVGWSTAGSAPTIDIQILAFLGLGFFVWGCMSYAEGKGHSKWLGFLGLLSFIGLLILVCLPDHHKQGK
jgi:hypothetical protein